MLYLVDSAGARITDQIEVFPGRRHGGKVFYNQVKMSGVVPQLTLLFGPSPAGAAYVPAFSDLVIMVDGNASAYLGSPRMAEMAIGEKVTLEQMGGARMHCQTSGLGDFLAKDEHEAIAYAREYLGYMPQHWREQPPRWEVFSHGGRKATGIDAVEWAVRMVEKGAGELLLTSIDMDGTKDGYDLELLAAITRDRSL